MIDLARTLHDAADAALAGRPVPDPAPVRRRIHRRRAVTVAGSVAAAAGLLVAAGAVAAQLAAPPVLAPAEPGPSWSPPAWFAEHEAQRSAYQEELQTCLRGLGWEVTVDRDGGIVEPFRGDEVFARYRADRARCPEPAGFPGEEALGVPPTEAELRDRYAKDLDTWACLRFHGFDVAQPSTLEEYVDTWGTGDGWRPHLDPAVHADSAEEQAENEALCPEPWPWAVAAP